MILIKGFYFNMIDPGIQKARYKKDTSLEKFESLKGFISEKASKKALVELLSKDPYMLAYWLFNIELYPIQVMMLKTMINRDRILEILPRGFGKSWTTALFVSIYALLNPGVRIGIVSASFRSSREIIKKIEEFREAKGAQMFSDCVGRIQHAPDFWEIEIGRSKVCALPLGQRIRGFRFQVVVVDELLLVPNEILKSIVLPFISTNLDPTKKLKVKKEEDKLIAAGVLKEEDRTIFPRSKFIGLSSASFEFEDLARTFESYEKKILTGKEDENEKESERDMTYALIQFSFEAAPEGLYVDGAIDDFRQQMSQVQFDKELRSIFVKDSGSFFSLEKMLHYSSKFGEAPFIEIAGEKGAEYIIGIDPSFSDSDSRDYFAMSILRIDRKNNKCQLVHGYEVAGGAQLDHIKYFAYLLKAFNVVYVIIDNAGWEFIASCNNSQVFKENKLNIEKFEHDYENDEKSTGLRFTKQNYNKELGKIVHAQYFSSAWIDKSNSILQTSLNFGRLWFAGPPDDDTREEMKIKAKEFSVENLNFTKDIDSFDKGLETEGKIVEFIDNTYFIIDRIRAECSLIEVSINPLGTKTYDLPRVIKMSKGKNRPRRDGYTSLLLANYAFRCYTDLMDPEIITETNYDYIPYTF